MLDKQHDLYAKRHRELELSVSRWNSVMQGVGTVWTTCQRSASCVESWLILPRQGPERVAMAQSLFFQRTGCFWPCSAPASVRADERSSEEVVSSLRPRGKASQDGFTSLQMTSLRTLFRTPYISPEKSARTSRKIGRDIPPFSLFFRHTCSRYLLLSGVNTGPLGRVHDGWQARRAYVLCLKGEVTMAPRRTTTSRPDIPPALDQLLTIKQAAARLGISDSKFYRLMRDRRVGIPVIRMPGHTTRIPAAKLQLWIERHTDQAM